MDGGRRHRRNLHRPGRVRAGCGRAAHHQGAVGAGRSVHRRDQRARRVVPQRRGAARDRLAGARDDGRHQRGARIRRRARRAADHARLPRGLRGARLGAAGSRPSCSTPSSASRRCWCRSRAPRRSPSASTIRATVLEPLDEQAVRAAPHGGSRARACEAVAVCYLFSFRNPRARGTHRRDPCRGGAELADLAVVARASGHPRIPAPLDHRDRRLCGPDHGALPGQPRPAAQGARRHHAAGLPDAVERRPDAHHHGRALSQPDPDLGACRRRGRRQRARAHHRPPQPRDLGYRRHQHRHQRDRRRARQRDQQRPYRRAGHRHADAGGAHARRRRRHHRVDRPRRTDEGRPAERGRGSRPGLLRPRRHARRR